METFNYEFAKIHPSLITVQNLDSDGNVFSTQPGEITYYPEFDTFQFVPQAVVDYDHLHFSKTGMLTCPYGTFRLVTPEIDFNLLEFINGKLAYDRQGNELTFNGIDGTKVVTGWCSGKGHWVSSDMFGYYKDKPKITFTNPIMRIKGYVNVMRNSNGEPEFFTTIYDSEQEAKTVGAEMNNYIRTVEISTAEAKI